MGSLHEYQVLIAGSGAAGMMAALTLADSGIRTLVLEKGSNIACSNAARAGGPALAGTKIQEEAGEGISPEGLFRHMYGFSRGTVNAGLLRAAIESGAEAERWLLRAGIELELFPDSYGVGFRAREFMKTPPKERWAGMEKLLRKLGGNLMLNTSAEELLIRDGRVRGVRTRDMKTGEESEIPADAVLLATGGYLGNPEMIRAHFGDITVGPLGSRLSDGAGIRMTVSAGGMEEKNWGICANEFGGWKSRMKSPFSYSMRYAIAGGLLVNRVGQRFMNEQYLSDEPLSLGGEMTLRVGKYYAVIDQKMHDEMLQADTLYDYYGRPEAWYAGKMNHSRKAPFPMRDDLSELIENGTAFCGESLEKLSETLQMPELPETVRAYNTLCEQGADTEFLKAPWLLKPVLEAPFYLVEYEPSAWCTLGGVRTDERCRALSREQVAIPGLYVAGVDNGSAYTAPYYDNEGACLGIAFGTGIVAAKGILKDLS